MKPQKKNTENAKSEKTVAICLVETQPYGQRNGSPTSGLWVFTHNNQQYFDRAKMQRPRRIPFLVAS